MINQHVIPQNIEIETSILSSIFLYQPDEPFELLQPGDFYRTSHQEIFRACDALYKQNQPVDLAMVANSLKEKGLLEQIGGATYLARLLDEPCSVSIEHHCQILKACSLRRRLIVASNEIIQACFNAESTENDIMNIAQKSILEIDTVKENATHIRDIMEERIDAYEEMTRNNGIMGISTGFYDLDRYLCGLQKANLYVVAGRPGMGKTAFALNLCSTAAEAGKGACIFSLEMAKSQLADRFISADAKINSLKFTSGRFSPDDWQKMMDSAGRLSGYNILIDDGPGQHIDDIRRKARKYHKKNNFDMLVIDYLQLVRGDKTYRNRVQEVGSVSRTCKTIAKELDIPVILISQLSREVEKRNTKRPIMSDLRESGEIEQDADIVLFIYRDDFYNQDENSPNKGMAEINIAKHRNGPTGTVKLVYLDKTMKFENLLINC